MKKKPRLPLPPNLHETKHTANLAAPATNAVKLCPLLSWPLLLQRENEQRRRVERRIRLEWASLAWVPSSCKQGTCSYAFLFA
jgi:hypothetical protein